MEPVRHARVGKGRDGLLPQVGGPLVRPGAIRSAPHSAPRRGHIRNQPVEMMVKHHDDRKLAFALVEEDELEFDPQASERESAWYQTDLRTRRLATLVGGGYSYVTIEIVYASGATPELRQVATWEGFDIQPQFAVFRAWLAEWEKKEDIHVQDLRATSIELVGEQEIALNPHILFVH